MSDIKEMAKAAKQRLKNNFWDECKRNIDKGEEAAREKGVGGIKYKTGVKKRVQSEIAGEKQDEFYLKVKKLLDEEGEVSDAIGRLTDKAYYDGLSYEDKQRYTFSLSAKYRQALERYKKEKELDP